MEQFWMHAYNKGDDQNGQNGLTAAPSDDSQPPKKTSRRGFASMDKEKQREIARKGGRAAHEKGTAHEFSSEEARQAGRKGGESVSKDRKHMAEIGRGGGQARSARLREKRLAEEAAAKQNPEPVGETPTEDGK